VSEPSDAPSVLARAKGPHGETALRRRGDVLELVVDGVFAMDSAHPGTEIALARLSLDRLPLDLAGGQAGDPSGILAGDLAGDPAGADGRRARPAVLVGGLGLGYTARAVLADPRVRRLVVVELDGALVGWAGSGLVPAAAEALADPRTEVVVDDVLRAVPALAPGRLDALLLDVDNGPGFLVHASNAGVYTAPFATACARALRVGGVLAVWSADPAPALRTLLQDQVGPCEEVLLPVERDGRAFTYAVYLATRRP